MDVEGIVLLKLQKVLRPSMTRGKVLVFNGKVLVFSATITAARPAAVATPNPKPLCSVYMVPQFHAEPRSMNCPYHREPQNTPPPQFCTVRRKPCKPQASESLSLNLHKLPMSTGGNFVSISTARMELLIYLRYFGH